MVKFAMEATTANNLQLCRICIASHSGCTQMISIFGEDSLWQKITTLADVKVVKGDTLPQQVCLTCAKNAISACLFKKKCEDADNFFRQQLLIQKFESRSSDGHNVEDVAAEAHSMDHISEMGAVENYATATGNACHGDEEHDADAHGIDANDPHLMMTDEDGEVKYANGKTPFDFQSIRLMHEYMQQQLSKINGVHKTSGAGGSSADSDAGADDDEPLPLIPEIEMITPSDEVVATSDHGYQCPNCFQMFELLHILKTHMKSVHGTPGPVYECSNCKKTYFYKRFLEKHVRRGRCVKKRRNQTRPMQCSDCHVIFPTGHHLGWHKRTGCPSRAAKMPLQQLLKQNIVEYNNFPKRVGIRKPENALYLHNRKLIMANNKRKGRTRIKLDSKKIALAKQLILREATTTVIANELNISRTFAWRLRKSLVNGVSLHERVIDPNGEECAGDVGLEQLTAAAEQQHQPTLSPAQAQSGQFAYNESVIKRAQHAESDESEGEEADNGDGDGENDDAGDADANVVHKQRDGRMQVESREQVQVYPEQYARMNEVTRMRTSLATLAYGERPQQEPRASTSGAEGGVDGDGDDNDDSDDNAGDAVGDADGDDNDDHDDDDETDNCGDDADYAEQQQLQQQQKQRQLYEQQKQRQAHDQQQLRSHLVAPRPRESERLQAQDIASYRDLTQSEKGTSTAAAAHANLSLLNQFPPAVAAAIHQLPVNLSIRPIQSLQSQEKEKLYAAVNKYCTGNRKSTTSSNSKKPRKPNVFVDEEKYALAKTLVAQNSSTMEIARALNVSQMTAWKVRDAIVKGVPLSYRSKKDARLAQQMDGANEGQVSAGSAESDNIRVSRSESETLRAQKLLAQQQQHQMQRERYQQEQLQQLQQQQQQQQQQLQQQKLKQQQQQQQEKHMQMLQRQQLKQEKLKRQQQHEQQQHQQLQLQQTQQSQYEQPATSATASATTAAAPTKFAHPRRRLKAAEREVRDKEITREILELIREDSNIQYWKVSARLAEKGFPISPSSVCQKLKSMGIHRRWKPGDKPPIMVDMEQLKAASVIANSLTHPTTPSDVAIDDGYAQQFDMGGAHFLSAFTH